jgi:hypothetical protein
MFRVYVITLKMNSFCRIFLNFEQVAYSTFMARAWYQSHLIKT